MTTTTHRRLHPGLLALAMGGFGIGLTEFSITGLLSDVAGDLRVSIPLAGGLVTGYALGVTAADADGGADRRALAAELREQDWSNKAIARHLGVHPSTVGRWLPRAHQSDEADPSGSQPEMEGALP